MASQFYGWTIPYDGQDPWFDAMVDGMRKADLSVRSVENIAPTRAAVVVSAVPGASAVLTINGSTTVSSRSWVPVSFSPLGILVGSFSIQGSGGHARFQLRADLYVQGSAGMITPSNAHVDFRLVGQSAVVSSLNFTGESAWVFPTNLAKCNFTVGATAQASLGPGNYSFEIQARMRSGAISSQFLFDADQTIKLDVIEVLPFN